MPPGRGSHRSSGLFTLCEKRLVCQSGSRSQLRARLKLGSGIISNTSRNWKSGALCARRGEWLKVKKQTRRPRRWHRTWVGPMLEGCWERTDHETRRGGTILVSQLCLAILRLSLRNNSCGPLYGRNPGRGYLLRREIRDALPEPASGAHSASSRTRAFSPAVRACKGMRGK